MMADKSHDNPSHANPVDLSSTKKKNGVLQKTREAIGKVNSKMKSNSMLRKGDMMEMMPFESESSFDFNPEADLPNVGKSLPLQAVADEKSNDLSKDEMVVYPDNRSKPDTDASPHSTRKIFKEGERRPQSKQSSPRVSSTKKSSRSLARSERCRDPTSSQPHRSRSNGNIHQRASHKPTSTGSPKKQYSAILTVNGPLSVQAHDSESNGESAGLNHHRKHVSSPTHARKEPFVADQLAGASDLSLETEQAEGRDMPKEDTNDAALSWKRVSRSFEDGDGAMGGYFAKLLEKMETDGSPEDPDGEVGLDEGEKEDQRTSAKFKTPKGIRKLFSLARSPRGTALPKDHELSHKNDLSDMEVFTAFISSPKAAESPKRSESKHIHQSCDDDSESDSEDFPEIPNEKHMRLDDIRREVNWKREGGDQQEYGNLQAPKTSQPKHSAKRSLASNAVKSSSDGRRGKGDSIHDPGSPGKWSSKHQRGATREAPEKSSEIEEEIPSHSMSNRRSRTTRPSEAKSSANDQLSRSFHRHRRTKGTSSRAPSELNVRPDTGLNRDDGDIQNPKEAKGGASKKPSSRRFGDHRSKNNDTDIPSSEPKANICEGPTSSELDRSGSRKNRMSSGKTEQPRGSNSSHGRRKRTSGPRKIESASSQVCPTITPREGDDSCHVHDAPTSSTREKRTSGSTTSSTSKSLLAKSLGTEPPSPSVSRRSRPTHAPRQAQLLMRSASLSNVNKGSYSQRDARRPESMRMKRQNSETKLSSVSEVNENTKHHNDEMPYEQDDQHLCKQEKAEPLGIDKGKKIPSLTETLERGSTLNIRLFDCDGQETVVTDDGSLWLDQGSVSGLNIKSSASVVAPQLVFDQNMTRLVEKA